MSESQMWTALRPHLSALDPVRIETRDRDGVPDVNYADGWIELKFKTSLPKQEPSRVELDHFTVEQRNWLRRRWDRGGRAWLLLYVRSAATWMLFDGRTAAQVVGSVKWAVLDWNAVVRVGSPSDPRLTAALTGRNMSPGLTSCLARLRAGLMVNDLARDLKWSAEAVRLAETDQRPDLAELLHDHWFA